MPEEISFIFKGSLADRHEMNFYEAARFQYDAARLLVKLAQFRAEGQFTTKITARSNLDIRLEAQEEGSFRINVTVPDPEPDESPLDVPLAALVAYVADRILSKSDDDDLLAALNSTNAIADKYGSTDPETPSASLATILRDILGDPHLAGAASKESVEVLERRLTEITQNAELLAERGQLTRIEQADQKKLVAMSAPLIRGMGRALKSSADSLVVTTSRASAQSNVLYLNKDMVREIETVKEDDELTPILCDIIQYNKETGWGKVRLLEYSRPISFHVPSDVRQEVQFTLMRQMRRDEVYLSVIFVRDRNGYPVRLLVMRVNPMTDE